MKKQLLTGALLLASFLAVQAQEIGGTNFGTTQEELQTIMTTEYGSYAFDTDEVYYGFFLNDPDVIALGGFSGYTAASPTFENTGTDENPVLSPLPTGANFIASPAIDLTNESAAYTQLRVGNIGAAGSIMAYTVAVMLEADWIAEDFANIYIGGEGTVNAGTASTVNVDLTAFVGEEIRLLYIHEGATSIGAGYFLLDNIVISSGVAGVKENLVSKLTVSPNPTSDIVNIANNENILVNNVSVTDLNGRTVKTVNFAGVSEAQVSLADLSTGVYMITISSDKGSVTKKIVKN